MKQNFSLPALLDSRSEFISSFDKMFDRMVEKSFPSFSKDLGVEFFGNSSYPKVDVIDTDTSILIHAEIPGLTKEEVEINVEPGKILSIKGSRKQKNHEEGTTWIIKELKHSSFTRKFLLGDNMNTDAVEAKFSNGILEITVPKIQIKKPEEKIVKIEIE